tara:strand:- start:222 stop:1628 length:1407 start_codon:yes stop_codon:yes gene_type:complete
MALDPYMEDYRDKEGINVPEPGDEMLPDDEQGLVSMLQDEQDPERKIMLAIQIIQSMGDRGIEIVESILSPEEIAMAVQVIQQMDTGADQGIDNVQMAASGGRIGLRGGGGDLEWRRMEAAAQRRKLGREGKFKDTADMYSWLSTADPSYREESFRDPMWQQWWAEHKGEGSPHGAVEAWKRAVIESGDPRGLFSGTITDTKYRSPEEIAQSKLYLDHYNRMASVLGMDPSSIASGAESQLSSEVAPWAEPAPAPITYPAETAAAPVEAAPVITTPAAVPAATGPAPVLESLDPMTYQTSYTTPTVADPTTNMSQYYSDALSTPYYDFQASAFGEPATTTAANVAAQYLNPQEAQVYQGAANGGRIGFQDGGDDYQSPPFIDDPAGTFDTDPMELREIIESEGTLKTASSMGDVFMQAMEDSVVLELDSWLMKYEPYGLREDDYFNFRTMGPQVRGPEATEGLASLRV